MTHYVLLKLAPDADVDAAEKTMREAYAALDRELPCFSEPAVHRCCTQRESNATLMASCRIDAVEHLELYLKHPLHIGMQTALKSIVVGRTTFDHQ